MFLQRLSLKAAGACCSFSRCLVLLAPRRSHAEQGGRRLKAPLAGSGSAVQLHTVARSITTPVQCPEDYFDPKKGISSNGR